MEPPFASAGERSTCGGPAGGALRPPGPGVRTGRRPPVHRGAVEQLHHGGMAEGAGRIDEGLDRRQRTRWQLGDADEVEIAARAPVPLLDAAAERLEAPLVDRLARAVAIASSRLGAFRCV